MEPEPRTRQRIRYRRIVFTVNNYTAAEYASLCAWTPTWLVIGKEKGEQGTPHLQGAAILGQQMYLAAIKKIPGLERARIEPMRGSPEHSLAYCSKEDAAPYIYGTLPQPGKRTDVAMAVEAVQEGQTMVDLATTNGIAVVKYFKGLTVLRSLLVPHRTEPPLVYWLHGATGTGKTKCAFLHAESVCPSSVWISSGSLQWFDGYDGQHTAIIDDFRPKGVKFDWLLRLFDRYPMLVPFKGGFVNWGPKVIIVTTPHPLVDTFEARSKHLPEDIAQLERRVTRSFCFPDDEAAFLDMSGGSGGSCGEDEVLETPGAGVGDDEGRVMELVSSSEDQF